MKITPINTVKVALDFGNGPIDVGRLAIKDRKIYFEYDVTFLKRELEISPLRLKCQTGVRSFDASLFEGMPGVFNDSLPDGWGRLLLDRSMRLQGILAAELSPLDRLIYVGHSGMGALVYEPDHAIVGSDYPLNLDHLSAEAQDVLNGEADEVLNELLSLNGSSAGARPKALIGIDTPRKKIIHGTHTIPNGYQHWIVKFPNMQDGTDSGAIEFIYSIIAREAGIVMTDTHLFPSKTGAGYFTTQRFDRHADARLHSHTACGLLHSDFRTPSLDYEDLIALTQLLTRDSREIEKMFRLAVFNVLAHNRDDHAKNFTFLMDANGEWKLAPAYDLTFSSGPRGEQSTMVMGEGRNPGEQHLIKLGEIAGINKTLVLNTIKQTHAALNRWGSLAKEYGVSKTNIALIANTFQKKNQ
jgi:serine/threonine-protein kinase HipA